MRVAYVTTYDSSDIHKYSGLAYYIRNAMGRAGFDMDPVGQLREKYSVLFKAKQLAYSKLLSKRYLRDREPTILRGYASQIGRAIDRGGHDVVMSPSTVPVAYLETDKPIVFWVDATLAGTADFYPSYTNLCEESHKDGHLMEQMALERSRLAIYSSDWAAQTAIDNYNVDPEKVKVVPYGANVECDRDEAAIETLLERKATDMCNLLFIGVHWERKGGPRALEVARILNDRGIKTVLHIVGCSPPEPPPDYVNLHGFVSKSTPEGRAKIDQLFKDAHFLCLPTRADCLPVVLAESSSFGLPSLVTRVGGIPTAVRDGKNGYTFDLDAPGEAWADQVAAVLESPDRYRQLARDTFREYTDRLNWETAGARVRDLIHSYCP